MTTKRYMQQYSRWKATYANKMAELQAIERDCILPDGIRYDMDKIQNSPNNDSMIRLIEQMDKRKKLTVEQMTRLRIQMQQFEDLVDKVDNADYKRLLHLYYIEGYKTLKDVSDVMQYSLDYVNHMHGEALSEIQNILKVNKK